MRPDVERWLQRRTSAAADWPAERLLAAKGPARVSVVLPALDEEATVGALVRVVRRELVAAGGGNGLVDEVVVVDSGSTDRTVDVARTAGADVYERGDVLPRVPPLPGKGEVMWRSLACTTGDVVVFVDADLASFSSSYVTGLLGPLLTDRSVSLVKAAYERPLRTVDGVVPTGGGRVTELVARPLLNLHWPLLAGFVQPLGGEYAARRSLLERLPFPTGYGVELGLLVDALGLVGLDALAQVDVGVRHHRHQDAQALGRMAATIYRTALERLKSPEADALARPELVQFTRTASGFTPRSTEVATVERPPMASIPEYLAAQQARQTQQCQQSRQSRDARQAPPAPQAQGRAAGQEVCPHP